MAPRRGAAGLLLALALSALAHGLALAILPGGPPPETLPARRPAPRGVTVYRPAPVTHPSIDIPAAGAHATPRRIEIRRHRTINLPPAPEPPRRRRPAARPARLRPPRGEPRTVPPRPARTPPLVAALAAADTAPVARVTVPDGVIVLALPHAGMTLGELLDDDPVVIAASAVELGPADLAALGEGWSLQPVAADDRLWTEPNDVRGWWRAAGQGEAKLVLDGTTVRALWLPLAVRAAWEARHPAALRLWDNLAADPRWQVAGESEPAAPGGSQ